VACLRGNALVELITQGGKNMTIKYCYMDSPLGQILLARDQEGLIGLWFEGQKYYREPEHDWESKPGDKLLKQAVAQLTAYFKNGNTEFDLPLSLAGTEFQQSVWQELLHIPGGETITYGELAKRLGKPKAVRAAAAAVGRNPASIIVPCHRVMGANGSLTGYAGGIERKQHLLSIESGLKLELGGA